MTIDLYCMGLQDRSDRVRWLLEEMGITYQDHFLSKSKGELKTAEYLAINAMGRVPTIIDGDITLFESGAICMYLADKYSYGNLAPKIENIKLRAEYTKWMIFSVASLECVVARMFVDFKTSEEEVAAHEFVKNQCEIFKLVLNPILSSRETILSSGLSAADFMLAAIIPGAHDYLVKGNPPLEAYMERMMKRDSALRAKVF